MERGKKEMMVCGDAREILRDWPGEYFDCIVTSPPYWGLRAYGTEPQVWGGKEGCEHEWGTHHQPPKGGKNLPNNPPATGADKHTQTLGFRNGGIDTEFCSLCGAWRGELGLEPDFRLYLDHLMLIMDECWRVLKVTGTVFINIGDSYATANGAKNEGFNARWHGKQYLPGKQGDTDRERPARPKVNIPSKSLCAIPARFQIAMIDRGWRCRNEIVWWKRNCMPSSASDRFTIDFEPLYFFTKSGKYWFEQQREITGKETPQNEYEHNKVGSFHSHADDAGKGMMQKKIKGFKSMTHPDGRNMRTVWDIPTKPFPEAHFATFPPELARRCVAAGCPPDGVVLDPFAGAGTVGLVCKQLQRDFIGIELKQEYCEMAENRISQK